MNKKLIKDLAREIIGLPVGEDIYAFLAKEFLQIDEQTQIATGRCIQEICIENKIDIESIIVKEWMQRNTNCDVECAVKAALNSIARAMKDRLDTAYTKQVNNLNQYILCDMIRVAA